MIGMIDGRAVRTFLGRVLAGQAAVIFGGPVRAGEHADNTGRSLGGGNIHRPDIRLRMRRAQDIPPRLTAQIDVVEELPAAGQKSRILFPRHRLADCELTHFSLRSAFDFDRSSAIKPANAGLTQQADG